MRTPGSAVPSRRLVLGLALAVCVAALIGGCGPGGGLLSHSGTPVPQSTTAAQVCRSQGPTYAYTSGDAVQTNPYLKCVLDGLIGEISNGTASVSYLVETYKNCNPDDQTTVAGWTLYEQNPLQPQVTATPGKYTGIGPTAPLYTADTPTRKGCFTGVTSIIKHLVGVTLPGNITIDQLRSGVLIFDEGTHMYDATPFQHPSMIISISTHLSHCPCDIQRLDLLPSDPAFLGSPGNPGRIAQEARVVYLAR